MARHRLATNPDTRPEDAVATYLSDVAAQLYGPRHQLRRGGHEVVPRAGRFAGTAIARVILTRPGRLRRRHRLDLNTALFRDAAR